MMTSFHLENPRYCSKSYCQLNKKTGDWVYQGGELEKNPSAKP
jgi:hypothetical protein